MKTYKILRFGMMKYTRRGVRLGMALTFDCTLKCSYCTVNMPLGRLPNMKPKPLRELQKFINDFPYRIREIKLSGGSPELHPDFVEFTNWLLDKGLFVQIFTNLTLPLTLMRLKRTYRLMFISTYHHQYDQNEYEYIYNFLSEWYRINVEEIGVKKLSFSRVKGFIGNEEMKKNTEMIRVSPDLRMFNTCYDVYANG